MNTSVDTSLRPQPWVETACLEHEVVLWDNRHRQAYRLNPSASAVWMCLADEMSVDEITAELSEVFEAPHEVVQPGVDAAMGDFARFGLLAAVDAVDQPASLNPPDHYERHRPDDRDLHATTAGDVVVLRPVRDCGCVDDYNGWAGKINFRSGRYVVAVEYDSDDTAAALRARCAPWSSSDRADLPAAFGVREAKVGFRRRRVGVVHHGASARHRLDGLDTAVDAVATFLAEIGRPRPAASVAVTARAFSRGDRLVLGDVASSIDVDERQLRRLGIDEIITFRPLVDLSTGKVSFHDTDHDLTGVVVVGQSSLDDARRRLWTRGVGPQRRWADFIDGLGDRLIWDDPDPASALDRALS